MFKLDCTEPFGQLGQPCENIELELGWQTQPDGLTTWQPGLLDSVGDVAEPRPGRKALNLLDYIYNKIFSKIVYVRWRNTPEAHQGIHQTWRCIFFETMCGKCLEWNAPLWFASLDSTKAFDRIENVPLFIALLEQGVPESYCVLFWTLYCQQTYPWSHRRFKGWMLCNAGCFVQLGDGRVTLNRMW